MNSLESLTRKVNGKAYNRLLDVAKKQNKNVSKIEKAWFFEEGIILDYTGLDGVNYIASNTAVAYKVITFVNAN